MRLFPFVRRSVFETLEQRSLEQRRTIMAQAAAIEGLMEATRENAESCASWRQLALNTADIFTRALRDED
jgi:hypothetical protein